MATDQPKKLRKPGAWRGWAADVPTEVFLEPMDPEDLDAAEGKFSDEFGISLPRPETSETFADSHAVVCGRATP